MEIPRKITENHGNFTENHGNCTENHGVACGGGPTKPGFFKKTFIFAKIAENWSK